MSFLKKALIFIGASLALAFLLAATNIGFDKKGNMEWWILFPFAILWAALREYLPKARKPEKA